MSLEEEGVQAEYLPEWARARLLEIDFYDDGDVRKLRVVAVRGVGGEAVVKVANWEWKLRGKGDALDSVSFGGESRPELYITV